MQFCPSIWMHLYFSIKPTETGLLIRLIFFWWGFWLKWSYYPVLQSSIRDMSVLVLNLVVWPLMINNNDDQISFFFLFPINFIPKFLVLGLLMLSSLSCSLFGFKVIQFCMFWFGTGLNLDDLDLPFFIQVWDHGPKHGHGDEIMWSWHCAWTLNNNIYISCI